LGAEKDNTWLLVNERDWHCTESMMVSKGISFIESSIRQLEKQEASWRLVIFGLVSENSLVDFVVFGQSGVHREVLSFEEWQGH
jgi:hypothetical protein